MCSHSVWEFLSSHENAITIRPNILLHGRTDIKNASETLRGMFWSKVGWTTMKMRKLHKKKRKMVQDLWWETRNIHTGLAGKCNGKRASLHKPSLCPE